MFSGLVTATSSVLEVKTGDTLLKLVLKKPERFKELKAGESIAIDGVCLTLTGCDNQRMTFDLGPETLKVTGWAVENLKNKIFNLERSLSLQSAVGGQILTGHGDALAQVVSLKKQGESCLLTVQIPKEFKAFIWRKGYLALSGVSLTVNQVKKNNVELCLIPETLKRTNLSLIKEGDQLIFEVDYMSRSFVHAFQNSYKKIHWFFIGFMCFVILALCFIAFAVSV